MKIKTDVPMDKIVKVKNSRNENQEIGDLKASIEMHGLFTPILLEDKGDHYEIIAGHRRFLAFQQLGKDTIPAVIETYDNNMIIQVTENIQRKGFSKEEESKIVYDLMEELDTNRAGMARLLGKDPSWVHKRVSFHMVREFLIKGKKFPARAIMDLTFDIAVAMAKYKQNDWNKMAAASLGKRWYPDQLKRLFAEIDDPRKKKLYDTPAKKSKTKANQKVDEIEKALNREEALEFSIEARDVDCILKLMFVSNTMYKKVKDVLQDIGGEII